MEDEEALQKLIEMLSAFYIEGKAVVEDLTHSLTSEFLRNIQDVMFTQQIVSYERFYKGIFIDVKDEMFSSTVMYLRYVLYACLQDAFLHFNIFERFLSAFAIILRTAIETSLETGRNYCHIVLHTFMGFYVMEMKHLFERRRGFRRFLEFINNPKFLESKCIARNISHFYKPNVSILAIPNGLREKAEKIMLKEKKVLKRSVCLDTRSMENSRYLTEYILSVATLESNPSTDFDACPADSVHQKTSKIDDEVRTYEISEEDLKLGLKHCAILNSDPETKNDPSGQILDKNCHKNIIKASDFNLDTSRADLVHQKTVEIDEEAKTFEISEEDSKLGLQHCTSLNSDLEAKNDPSGQILDNKGHKNVIEAVIRHNRSKSSYDIKSNDPLLTDADEILVDLRKTIKSLIDILDEKDE